MRISLGLAIAAATAGCGLPEGDYFGVIPADPDPTHVRYCNSSEPRFVDPTLMTDTASTPLGHIMFAGLADWGPDFTGAPVPDLAQSWDVAEDYRTFTFHLRDGLKWSNHRPLTSADFVYGVMRILHPSTLSENTTPLMPIKNAALFNERRVKMLLADSPPFSRGDVVEVIGQDGKVSDKPGEVPDSNLRKSSRALKLRDQGAQVSDAYATVPAGEEVEIVELGGAQRDWAYVFWPGVDWYYGWVPLAELDIQPNGKLAITVRDVPPEHRVGVTLPPDPAFKPRQGTVAGANLLMVPEVLGLRAPDPRTLIVETWSPVPYLEDDIQGRQFRPTPRESVSRSPLGWTRPQNGLIVTSGAFTLTEWYVRDRIEMVKSDTYWDAANIKYDRFTSYQVNDQAAATNYYMQGGCDLTTNNNIPFSYLPAVSGDKRGRPYKDFDLDPYAGIYYYVINTEKVPNVHLRRAINHAVDRSPIPRILHGHEEPTASFTPGTAIRKLTDAQLALCGLTRDTPGTATIIGDDEFCYVPPPGVDFDPAKAKQELALARKELGAKFPKSIAITFNSGVEGHKVIAEYVQYSITSTLGIDIQLSSIEWKTYLAETNAGNYQIARMGWIGSTPDPESQFLLVFRCGSPYNRSRWCSQEYERLFKQAEATPDRKQRIALLQQAEKVMIEEAPIIPLYVYTQKNLAKPYVKGIRRNIGAQVPLQRVWIDPDWRSGK